MLLIGHVIDQLRTLPDKSVHCCVTSPPYWGLRNYGTEPQIWPAEESYRGALRVLPQPSRSAWRGELGLEPTPDLYVQHLVQIFREVHRVLRDDGTLWLNLGDSYVAGKTGNPTSGSTLDGGLANQIECKKRPDKSRVFGLKPKDLVGIPWSVAKALQQPYYTGRIKNIQDRIWLAAMIDAEGCMFIHKRKAGQPNGQGYFRQNDNYGPGLEVANTSEVVVKKCLDIVGLGSICSQSPEQNDRRKQTIYRWNLRTIECRDIIQEVYPHLVAKQHQARILCACPSSGDVAERSHAALIGLHNGVESDVDFKPPESMFELGFYLRQDVIWSKANPMPESVQDRCTKSHEYIFLFSKSANYFYDNVAIAEPSIYPDDDRKARTVDGLKRESEDEDVARVRRGSATYPLRNRRDVWTIPTVPYPAAHFAVFPPEIPRLCILAGTSSKGCCPQCHAPFERIVEKKKMVCSEDQTHKETGSRITDGLHGTMLEAPSSETVGWQPTCQCTIKPPHFEKGGIRGGSIPCTVLDPFSGSGTTLAVAAELGRNFIGIDLNPANQKLTDNRLARADRTIDLLP